MVVRGKWRIDRVLGVGGMATVYAATHRNGNRVALKILHREFSQEKQVCERFRREAYVSNRVGHPSCVSVLDDDETDEGEPFLVMELLEGETLRDYWIRIGVKVPVVDVLQIADPILDCLAACHAIGVIHRDLKPANIFITSKGELKILDFGVAQFRSAASERTATGTALGTPSYMSPEQAMGLVDQLDGRADLFSVGAIIHALCTGVRINQGRSESEALVMAATKPVPSVARIAPDLDVSIVALIDKSLAWDRRARFEGAKEMQQAVRDALRNLTGNSYTGPSPMLHAPEPNQRGRLPLTSTGSNPGASRGAPTPPSSSAPSASDKPVVSRSAPGASPLSGRAAPPPLPPSLRTGGHERVSALPVPPLPKTPGALGAPRPSRPDLDPQRNSDVGSGQRSAALRPPSPSHGQAPASAVPQTLASPGIPQGQAPRSWDVAISTHNSSDSALVVEGAGDEGRAAERASDFFRRFERMLPNVRQYGESHPMTERALQTAHEGMAELLRGGPISVDVRPYSMMVGEATAWEPSAPFDAIPYHLFASGVRRLRVLPNFDRAALTSLTRVLLLEPGRDLPPEDDLATALWDEAIVGVAFDAVDPFVDGDADVREAFLSEADELEKVATALSRENAAVLEARAMALSVDRDALERGLGDNVMALSDLERRGIEAKLDVSTADYSARYIEVLASALVDADRMGDVDAVLRSLSLSAADLVVAGRIDLLTSFYFAQMERLRGEPRLATLLTDALFGTETLMLVRAYPERFVSVDFSRVFPLLSPANLPALLAALTDEVPKGFVEDALDFVTRSSAGYEQDVIATLPQVAPQYRSLVLSALARGGTRDARTALGIVAQGRDPILALDAKILLAPAADVIAREMAPLLSSSASASRQAALSAILRHKLVATAPTLMAYAQRTPFASMEGAERRLLMETLAVIVGEPGEALLTETARKGGLFSSAERDAARITAIEVLGQHGRTHASRDALSEITQARWGTSEEVRNAARIALSAIQARASAGSGGGAP